MYKKYSMHNIQQFNTLVDRVFFKNWRIEFFSIAAFDVHRASDRHSSMYVVVVNNTAERAALLEWLIGVTFISQHNKKKCHPFLNSMEK